MKSNCSVPSQILDELRAEQRDPVDEEIEIDVQLFTNQEELNTSKIEDLLTNQCLAFIAGYVVVKIENSFEWKLCRNALHDNQNDPLDKENKNVSKSWISNVVCVSSKSVLTIVLASENVFQLMLSKGLRYAMECLNF